MATTTNNPADFDYAEQNFNSNLISIFTKGGAVVTVKEEVLIAIIEAGRLNITTCGTGLTCDPDGTEYSVTGSPAKYLDDNFDAVCEMYLKTLNS